MTSRAHHKGVSLKVFANLLKLPSKFSKHSPKSSNQASTPLSKPSPFLILPAELCIHILTDAAKFSQTDEEINPYSSAVALCCVSRTIRHIVLPELLHTVLLSKGSHVSAFIYALEMQDEYARKGNHLHFDYAANVRRIWIGETSSLTHTSINFSLLAPVLFASKSLALDTGSMPLLDSCLTQMWNLHTVNNREPLRPPWNTTTLTLAGGIQFYCPTTQYATHTLRSRFFASIDQFIFFPPTTFIFSPSQVSSPNIYRYYIAPIEVDKFPWTSLESPQTILLVYPYVTLLSPTLCGSVQSNFRAVDVTLKTIGAPVTRNHSNKEKPYPQPDIPSFYVRVALSFTGGVITGDFNWEQTWACRISP